MLAGLSIYPAASGLGQSGESFILFIIGWAKESTTRERQTQNESVFEARGGEAKGEGLNVGGVREATNGNGWAGTSRTNQLTTIIHE
jgi:hypothetical protein